MPKLNLVDPMYVNKEVKDFEKKEIYDELGVNDPKDIFNKAPIQKTKEQHELDINRDRLYIEDKNGEIVDLVAQIREEKKNPDYRVTTEDTGRVLTKKYGLSEQQINWIGNCHQSSFMGGIALELARDGMESALKMQQAQEEQVLPLKAVQRPSLLVKIGTDQVTCVNNFEYVSDTCKSYMKLQKGCKEYREDALHSKLDYPGYVKSTTEANLGKPGNDFSQDKPEISFEIAAKGKEWIDAISSLDRVENAKVDPQQIIKKHEKITNTIQDTTGENEQFKTTLLQDLKNYNSLTPEEKEHKNELFQKINKTDQMAQEVFSKAIAEDISEKIHAISSRKSVGEKQIQEIAEGVVNGAEEKYGFDTSERNHLTQQVKKLVFNCAKENGQKITKWARVKNFIRTTFSKQNNKIDGILDKQQVKTNLYTLRSNRASAATTFPKNPEQNQQIQTGHLAPDGPQQRKTSQIIKQ